MPGSINLLRFSNFLTLLALLFILIPNSVWAQRAFPVVVTNQQPIDVVVRQTANGYVLSTRLVPRCRACTPAGIDEDALEVPFASYLVGVNTAAVRNSGTSFCEVSVRYPDNPALMPVGQIDPSIVSTFYGPDNGSNYIALPDLFVGAGVQLIVEARATNLSGGSARCLVDAQLYFRRRPGSIVPPGG